jgi:hypothetical protein
MRVYICSKDYLFPFTEKAVVGRGDRGVGGGGRRLKKKAGTEVLSAWGGSVLSYRGDARG